MRESKTDRKKRTEQIIKLLKQAHPDAHCALNHSNAFELLIATILSAQCTDERVNLVTAELFRKYHHPADYMKVPLKELEQDVRSASITTRPKVFKARVRFWSKDTRARCPRRWRSCVNCLVSGAKRPTWFW